ncbi:hypothetical protein HELRODRAFT_82849, partial [Helobdella robusta]|uniref:NAD(+) diphosphatase n=1 Tax=Helobdella robusta TaxID=6412 RepID=T1G4X4_HELRO
GWTALMFASKNGQSHVVRELIRKGSDPLKVNSTGQTAQDLAEFWLHGEVVNILSSSTSQPEVNLQRRTNYLCDNPLDRSSKKRSDDVWMKGALTDPLSVFVVLSGLCPLVIPLNENKLVNDFFNFNSQLSDVKAKLARFSYEQALQLSPNLLQYYIFLGREQNEVDTTSGRNHKEDDDDYHRHHRHQQRGYHHGRSWFAVETKLSPTELHAIEPGITKLPFPLGFSSLMRSEAAIVCQARSMMAWHDRNQFCSTCGSASVAEEAGYKRRCRNDACKSNKGGAYNTCYPRLDPTVIMAISSPDNKRLLLGRNKRRHIPNMWSVLAGFMEPGESIEEACRREVFEETRVNVGEVSYHSSQPWPMPSTLMIGCIGRAIDSDIVIDESELAEARWFQTSEVKQMLDGTHPECLTLPPPQAIAHQLILQWLGSSETPGDTPLVTSQDRPSMTSSALSKSSL